MKDNRDYKSFFIKETVQGLRAVFDRSLANGMAEFMSKDYDGKTPPDLRVRQQLVELDEADLVERIADRQAVKRDSSLEETALEMLRERKGPAPGK